MTSVDEMASALDCFKYLNMMEGDKSKWCYSMNEVDIKALVSRVVNRGGNVSDLIVLWAIMRDVNGEYGWRDGSHLLFFELYKYFPETMTSLLSTVPHFGCWRDYSSLYELSMRSGYTDLSYKVVCIWVNTIMKDYNNMRDGKTITNCAKYIPKEGRSLDKRYKVVDMMVYLAFPEMRSLSLSKRRWRRMCSELNRNLNVTETKMNGNWSEINFEDVPKSCFLKYMDSFMYKNKGKHTDIDRLICKNNCINYLRKCRKTSRTRDRSLEEIARSIRKNGKLSVEDEVRYESMYENECLRLMGLCDTNKNGFVVSDMSGSMLRGDKIIDQVVSSTIMVSDISRRLGSVFGGSYMKTGISPIWTNLSYPDSEEEYERIRGILGEDFRPSRIGDNYSLMESVKICNGSSGGGSIVDIVKCYDTILDVALRTGIDSEDMLDWVLFMSDIEFEHMMLYMGRNRYETLSDSDEYFKGLGVKPIYEVMEHLEKAYEDCGYKLPKLIYYNVREDVELDVTIDDNVVQIVGYDEKLLDNIYSNEFEITELEEKFDNLRYSIKYYTIYSLIDHINEIS